MRFNSGFKGLTPVPLFSTNRLVTEIFLGLAKSFREISGSVP